MHAAGSGLNYAAILDTAADIARAMAHLHRADVLHGDLKVGVLGVCECRGREGRAARGPQGGCVHCFACMHSPSKLSHPQHLMPSSHTVNALHLSYMCASWPAGWITCISFGSHRVFGCHRACRLEM
jgi:hypothetical protein